MKFDLPAILLSSLARCFSARSRFCTTRPWLKCNVASRPSDEAVLWRSYAGVARLFRSLARRHFLSQKSRSSRSCLTPSGF